MLYVSLALLASVACVVALRSNSPKQKTAALTACAAAAGAALIAALVS